MVITQDEASRAIGASPGEPLPTGTGEGCSFGDRKDANATTLLINVTADDSAAKFSSDRAVASAAAVVKDAGVGDESFSYGTASVQSAEARKGSIRVRILLEGPRAAEATALEMLRVAVARV